MRPKRIAAIARFEFLAVVKRWSYLLATFGLPLFSRRPSPGRCSGSRRTFFRSGRQKAPRSGWSMRLASWSATVFEDDGGRLVLGSGSWKRGRSGLVRKHRGGD